MRMISTRLPFLNWEEQSGFVEEKIRVFLEKTWRRVADGGRRRRKVKFGSIYIEKTVTVGLPFFSHTNRGLWWIIGASPLGLAEKKEADP